MSISGFLLAMIIFGCTLATHTIVTTLLWTWFCASTWGAVPWTTWFGVVLIIGVHRATIMRFDVEPRRVFVTVPFTIPFTALVVGALIKWVLG